MKAELFEVLKAEPVQNGHQALHVRHGDDDTIIERISQDKAIILKLQGRLP